MRKTPFIFLFFLSLFALAQTPQQYVLFRVTPKDGAKVVLNGEELPFRDGTASKRMPFGTYAYSVEAPMHHAVTGEVTVNDLKDKHVVLVDLRPAYGYLHVPADGSLSGASVFVDDAFVGKTPYKSGRLTSGTYGIRIEKEMYEPVNQTVAIDDGKTTTFSPNLAANYANLTFVAPKNAEIWLNGVCMGSGKWSGQVECGAYDVECRKKYYRATTMELRVTREMTGRTITLKAPMAITGSIDISSSPADASVFLDNRAVGTTPLILDSVSGGEHKIRLRKKNYVDIVKNVTVTGDQTIYVDVEMGKPINVVFPTLDYEDKISTEPIEESQSAGRTVAQEAKEEVEDKKVHDVVEVMPTFPGGESALLNYVSTHLKYPAIAQEEDIQGVVNLKFVVLENGAVGDVKIVKSLHPACDKAAIAVVKSLARFIPGKKQGRAVKVWYNLPICFTIM